jgi:streptogramin lyase
VILGRILTVVCLLLGSAFVGGASAATIVEFPANPEGETADPLRIAAGPDGNLWFVEGESEAGIGRMTTAGEPFALIHDANKPVDLVTAPSGWVSWVSEEGFGTRNPSGVAVKYKTGFRGGAIALTADDEVRYGGKMGNSSLNFCTPNDPASDHLEVEAAHCGGEKSGANFNAMAASAGDTLWASTDVNTVKIFTASTLDVERTVELPTGSSPQGIAIGPEGNAWVAMPKANAVDRIAPDGTRTRFAMPAGSEPFDLAYGPDGAFWVLEAGLGKIGRMTAAGLLTGEYPIPSAQTEQTSIVVGPDGNIWFADPGPGLIGRLVPDPLMPDAPPVAPAPAPGGAGGGGSNPDKSAPRFTVAPKFVPARFSNSSGSTLKFTLSEAATVTATIARKAPGRRAGRKCVAPRKAQPGAKKCSRYLPKGALKLAANPGANTFPFKAKLAGKPLAPGGYRASLTARDPAGNTSAAVTAPFTITNAR